MLLEKHVSGSLGKEVKPPSSTNILGPVMGAANAGVSRDNSQVNFIICIDIYAITNEVHNIAYSTVVIPLIVLPKGC